MNYNVKKAKFSQLWRQSRIIESDHQALLNDLTIHEEFVATALQTTFKPTSFNITEKSKLTVNGYRKTSGFTITNGAYVLDEGLTQGTPVIIDKI